MRLTKLDGLRGIASLMVVFFHYGEGYLPERIYGFFLIRESYTFVDFFFVLSGFVITYNYNDLKLSTEFWIYLKKRFIRLYPMLFFSVMVYFLFRTFTLYFFPLLVDGNASMETIALKALDSLFLTNSTPLLGSSQGLNIPSWSISSEMISYIVFGGIAILMNRNQRRIIFSILILASGALLFEMGSLFKMGDYGFLRGMFAFLTGYFVWEISVKNFKVNKYFEYVVPLMVLSILYALYAYKTSAIGVGMQFLVPFVFGISILVLLKTDGFLSKLLNLKPFRFLGDISYSLYLNHYLILLIVPRMAFSLFKIEKTDLNQISVFLTALFISIVYSFVTYTYVELPCSKMLKKRFIQK